MKKIWLTCSVTLMTAVFLLTGCGSADRQAVTETTENFLQALADSDLDAAGEYATQELLESEEMKLLNKSNLEDSFYRSIKVDRESLDEEAQKAVAEYVGAVVDRAYVGYEVGDVKIQKDEASVTTQVRLGFDPDARSNLAETLQDDIDAYRSENYEELVSIYVEEGEQALYNKIYNDLIPIAVSKMREDLENSEEKTESTILTLRKTDGTWKVTELRKTQDNAGEGDTAAEGATEAAAG